ncbi:3370_t:CDS:10 [Ambispora gerdemannii]|uniref:3370_t:CDS:1 n=1 Tax=Ambispora gerdemannii TaxID=144530 RepID=A0A9N9GMC1_9GLOM|nr:3370_t:CDS:10 [Ambispora gerdemannii]
MATQMHALNLSRTHFAANLLLIHQSHSKYIRRSVNSYVRGFHYSLANLYANAQQTKPDYGKTFDKILIANRGEIAVRVIRTAKKMGIKTVAIYSDADARSLHVRLADEAVNVGPPPTNQSYLHLPAILDAIKSTGAQAVHPGYGFLSENAHFVKALDELGITFIGPGEYAMGAMGDKIESKIIAKKSGVNVIPGFDGICKNEDHAFSIARELGYPVMLKASAGGGGKGMRIAWNDDQIREGFKLATQESKSSFGDDRLLVEKYVDNPRHIEIQIIADKHGNCLYLPERECSIQRRNQKVIEEAPSTHLDETTRQAMGEQAVALAKHVNYSSAGTVEFLVDSQRNFYFLEMNTRLQVEHPITEYITRLDLVEQMIRVAANQKLSFKQEDINFRGWAIESRVYAEDPQKYLPSIGRLSKYIEPVSLTDKNEVRCDSGVIEGSEISVTHNIPLLREVIGSERFQSGKITTKFLAEEYPEGFQGHVLNQQSLFHLASVAALVHAKRDVRNWCWGEGKEALLKGTLSGKTPHTWDLWVKVKTGEGGFQNVPVRIERKHKSLQDKDEFLIKTLDQPPTTVFSNWPIESPIINAHFQTPDKTEEVLTVQYIDPLPVGFRLQYKGTKFDITIHTQRQHELSQYMIEKPKADLTKVILAPMPGSVVSLAVKVGDEVNEGAELAIVEAMKMQNVLKAARLGKIKKVNVKPGDAVATDEVIIEFED